MKEDNSAVISHSPLSSVLTFNSLNKWYVRILDTGAIEINPELTLDEAATGFWEAVKKLNPYMVKPEPVLYIYELAMTFHRGVYSDWEERQSRTMPQVPTGAIRNLRTLGEIKE